MPLIVRHPTAEDGYCCMRKRATASGLKSAFLLDGFDGGTAVSVLQRARADGTGDMMVELVALDGEHKGTVGWCREEYVHQA